MSCSSQPFFMIQPQKDSNPMWSSVHHWQVPCLGRCDLRDASIPQHCTQDTGTQSCTVIYSLAHTWCIHVHRNLPNPTAQRLVHSAAKKAALICLTWPGWLSSQLRAEPCQDFHPTPLRAHLYYRRSAAKIGNMSPDLAANLC